MKRTLCEFKTAHEAYRQAAGAIRVIESGSAPKSWKTVRVEPKSDRFAVVVEYEPDIPSPLSAGKT